MRKKNTGGSNTGENQGILFEMVEQVHRRRTNLQVKEAYKQAKENKHFPPIVMSRPYSTCTCMEVQVVK